MREGFCPKCGNKLMIGALSGDRILFCDQCSEEFPVASWLKSDKLNEPAITPTSEIATLRTPSALRLLPIAFYIIAWLGFVALTVLAIEAGSGYLFGYGIGSTIACLGSGRVIELLQIIADELQQKRLSESP